MNISPTVLITMIIQPLAVKAKASLFTFLMLEKGAFLNDVMQARLYLCDTSSIQLTFSAVDYMQSIKSINLFS